MRGLDPRIHDECAGIVDLSVSCAWLPEQSGPNLAQSETHRRLSVFQMPLKPEQKARLLASTRPSAIALLDELRYLRTVCERIDPSPAEIRLVAVALRRLLVNRELADIAAPRLGRILLSSPDNEFNYRLIETGKVVFFAASHAQVFNLKIAGFALYVGTDDLAADDTTDADKRIQLRLDNFLNQRMFYWNNFDPREARGEPVTEKERAQWATRKDVIKYVANIGHGAHSGAPSEPEEHFIRSIPEYVRYDRDPTGMPLLSANFPLPGLGWKWKPYPYSPTAIDPVLFDVLATASLVCASPDVLKLEGMIKLEIGA